MNIRKAVSILFACVFISILIIFIYIDYTVSRTLQAGCQRIEKIARDEKAVTYLDNWVSDNILDKGYHYVSGMHGSLWASVGDQIVDITQLPEERISGIEREYLRLSINKIDGSFDSELTSENVGQINIGRGRNQVIILKNGKALLSYRGDNEPSGKLLKINENIFAYCVNSKFEA